MVPHKFHVDCSDIQCCGCRSTTVKLAADEIATNVLFQVNKLDDSFNKNKN